MTINEQYEAAKAALVQAKSGEDADALAKAIEEFKAAEAAKKSADEAASIIDALGNTDPVKKEPDMTDAKTLGEFAAKNLDLTAMRAGSAKSAGTGFGFKAATDPQTSQQMLETSRVVTDTAVRDLAIRNLFGAESITGNALKYFILGAKEGTNAPGTVAENGAKPQFHIVEGSDTATLQKVAGWFYETDELLSDAPFLRSAIDNRGMFELAKAADAYLATTLLATSGIQSKTYAQADGLTADVLFEAMMAIKTQTGYDADAILINPTDYAALRLAKDGASQYYGGGYFYAPFGNGQLETQPGIWGLRTIVTTAVAAGAPVVGAFKAAASVVSKAGEGASIEVHRGDHDDAINNRVTVVVEERLALAVRVPAAFVKVSQAA